MKTVLIAGAEPFGGQNINSSYEAVKNLPDKILNIKLVKLEYPVVYDKCFEALKKVIEKEKPDVVICVGQAGGKDVVKIERVAINVNDSLEEDNEGNIIEGEVICEDGKNAYFSNLPTKEIVTEINKNGIPCTLSNSAGTFVCNNVMYLLLDYIDKNNLDIKGGFIHVPCLLGQIVNNEGVNGMSLENLSKSVEIAIINSVL